MNIRDCITSVISRRLKRTLNLLLKAVITVQYVKCYDRKMSQCHRGPEDSETREWSLPAREWGASKTLELDFKGKLEIDGEKRTDSSQKEKHKWRQQDMKGLDKVGCNKSSIWPEKESCRGKWCREGNGNPLQWSCLENPRDRGAGGLLSMGSHRVGHD